VWFKTRAGLVCVEGPVEILADRWTKPTVGKFVGVFACQLRYKYRWLLPRTTSCSKMYLACFPDTESTDVGVEACFQRIEKALKGGELVCDLSDLGTTEGWKSSKSSIVRK
jgi:hypothetical protein